MTAMFSTVGPRLDCIFNADMLRLSLAAWLACAGCRREEVAETPWITAEDGATLRVRTQPTTLVPGDAFQLVLALDGVAQPSRVWLVPSRMGSMQWALGASVPAPPPFLPAHAVADSRVQSVDVPLAAREMTIDWTLPATWHARTATVLWDAAAVSGPRRADGRGVVALLPVDVGPTRIRIARAVNPITLDGIASEPVWQRVPETVLVESLEGEPQTPTTAMRGAYDDHALYVFARLRDHDVWANHTQHDAPLWEEEAFELFVFHDVQGAYVELQVAPSGVRFDARFTARRRGDDAWNGSWQAAASVEGTLDNRRDRDHGWSVEIAVPWTTLCEAIEVGCNGPAPGNEVRLNAFRLDRTRRGARAWALSPTRIPDFHNGAAAAFARLE